MTMTLINNIKSLIKKIIITNRHINNKLGDFILFSFDLTLYTFNIHKIGYILI